jgi:agmatine deiminase
MDDPRNVFRDAGASAMNVRSSRRAFLAAAGLAAAGTALGGSIALPTAAQAAAWSVVPDDTPHKRTWMAWPSSTAIWGRTLLPKIQADIATIAKTIAKYEPVVMCADGTTNAATARSKCGSTVTVISSIPVDDCWMRDSGPQFRRDGLGHLNVVGLNFNAWGNKQTHNKDKNVAMNVAAFDGLAFTTASFVGEGGAIENDGDGTCMGTVSSLVNANRNPGKTQAQVEAAILAAYGAQKMIWFPGLVGQDITDDHVDATSRFVRPGVGMVQLPLASQHDIWSNDERSQYGILSTSTDAKGRAIQVIQMAGPDPSKMRVKDPNFVDSYVNYHVVNGAVITAQFGDTSADAASKATLAAAYPGRVIEQINIDNLGDGGGGIHCVTMGEPLP